ncbi:hypothetical protein F444_04392 [Phytophthora nicotianae P1976]|nr:hypothetical protein F444_04392 [Phytophthora nicotianae P1976]
MVEISRLPLSSAQMASLRRGKKVHRETEDATRPIANKAHTVEEKQAILVLHASLRVDNANIPRKESIMNKIDRLFDYSNKTCGEIWSSFLSQGTVFTAAQRTNRGERIARLP